MTTATPTPNAKTTNGSGGEPWRKWTPERTAKFKATMAAKRNAGAGKAAKAGNASPARIIRQLVKGTPAAKVAEQLGVHVSTVYLHRKRAVESGELPGPKTTTKTKASAKSPAAKKKRGTNTARGAALADAIVYLQHAQDAGAPELRRVSNESLLAELALRRLDGRMK